MPWPTYSERFVESSLEAAWTIFAVPAGKRAVVKCISFVNNTAVEYLFIARIHNFYVANRVIPASAGQQLVDLHFVAYQGEEIGTFTYSPVGHCTMSGYLLDDASGRRGPPPGAAQQPNWPPPENPLLELSGPPAST